MVNFRPFFAHIPPQFSAGALSPSSSGHTTVVSLILLAHLADAC